MPRFATHVLALLILSIAAGGGAALPASGQSTYTVNSAAALDDTSPGDGTCETSLGSCTLRAAIQEANATPTTRDLIDFAIPTSGTLTISESIQLDVTAPVLINGTTAPAYTSGGPPVIVLDGSATASLEDGLLLDGAPNSEVRALSVVNYDGDGIEIRDAADTDILACYVGIEPDGTPGGNGDNGIEVRSEATIGGTDAGNLLSGNADDGIYVSDVTALLTDNVVGLDENGNFALPNQRNGISVVGANARVTIQRNTISGNTESGVRVYNGESIMTGNVIGLNVDQTAARANETGVLITSDGSIIGGNDFIFANVIAGNTGDGISLGVGVSQANGNTVQYNYIGTNRDRDVYGQNIGLSVANGTGNTVDQNVVGFNAGGIFVGDDARGTEVTRNYVGVTPDGFDIGNTKEGIIDASEATSFAEGTKIGLASPGTSNYVSFNDDAVVLNGQYTTVQNNFIGSEGRNERAGILMDRASNVQIGTPGFGNEIVFNMGGGIVIESATDVTIQGNYIGVTASGSLLGNDSHGIEITPSVSATVADVTIGYDVGASIPESNAPLEGGLGNRIRNNTLDGVRLSGDGTVEGVSVRGNIIASNGEIGVDLGPDGVTANDFGDTDTGVNNLQNTPEIDQSQTTYNTGTGDVEVRYRVDCNTTDCAYDLTVDFYAVDSEVGGEGETYLGTDTYPVGSASAFRNISFTPPSDVSVSTSDFIVGIATDANGNSSEFTGTPRQLPVELAGFTARATDQSVVLTWKTLSETGNDRFEVERKGTGASTFRRVGTVEGADTTTETSDYRFETGDLSAGTHTFRLRQVDVDGSEELSGSVTARVELGEAIALSAPSPNPVRNQLSFQVGVQESQTVRVVLYDLLGRAVATLHQGTLPGGEERTIRATLPTLPSGKYFLRLEGDAGHAVQPVTIVR